VKLRKSKTKASPSRRQRQSSGDRLQPSSNYSYSSQRSEEPVNLGRQTERTKARVVKNAQFWLQRFGMIILLLVVIIAAFKVISLSSNPRILLFDSNSALIITPSERREYQAAADKILSKSALNRNKITVNTNDLSKQMMSEFPGLESVDVSIPLMANRPVVYLEPAQPALVLSESNGSYEITSNGRAVLKSSDPKTLNLGSLPVLKDQSGLQVQLNHQVLPTNYIGFIQTVIGQLTAKGITVSSMTLPSSAEELDVYPAGQSYYIKFNLVNNDPRQQVGTYLATLASLKSQKITPSKYVDVRVDGRAYYQ
jgi:hypothetical protein